MGKNLFVVIGFIFSVTLLMALLLLVGGGGGLNAEGRTITVDDDGEAEYFRIQDAINASEDGDTVRVWDGVYEEYLIVNKTVNLIGNGSGLSIIDGANYLSGMKIENNSVLVSGFKVINCGWKNDTLYYEYAIAVKGVNCTISNNIFGNNFCGIFLGGVSGIVIENNDFTNCTTGIWCAYSNNNRFLSNSFHASFLTTEVKYGIWIGGSQSSTFNYSIEMNSFRNGLDYGVYCGGSSSNISLLGNLFMNIKYGFNCQGLDNILFQGNTGLSNNVTVIISISTNVIITNSTFRHNEFALKLAADEKVSISNCTIESNDYGISIDFPYEDSSSYSITNNWIIGNMKYGIHVFRQKGSLVVAMGNYWGHDSGPYHQKSNPHGQGDNVTDHIIFEPWLPSDFSDLRWGEDKDDEKSDSPILFIGSAIFAISLGSLMGIAYLREDLRFLLLALLVTPLHSRLEKGDVLEQPKRQEIFSYIVNKPGSNLTRLHTELPIGYGTLVHHLKVLEREKHIRSRKEMGRKLFFPTGSDWAGPKHEIFSRGGGKSHFPADDSKSRQAQEAAEGIRTLPHNENKNGSFSASSPAPREETSVESVTFVSGAGGRSDSLDNLSSVPVGLRIIEHLGEHGPATQADLMNELGVPLTTVSYSLRKLVEDGKVAKSDEKGGAVYELRKEG
jgi:parallel beta-helix repeat protein